MKKVIFTIAAMISCSGAYAQNIIPDSGDVHINAHVLIDSSLKVGQLSVREHVSVHGNISISEKFTAEGLGTFENDLNVGSQFTVGGKSRFNNDVSLSGPLYIDSLEEVTDYAAGVSFMSIDSTRGVKKIPIMNILNGIYKLPCITDLNGNTPNPSWKSDTNMIYTLCSKVGVGAKPLYDLDVRGDGYFSRGIRIGTLTPSSEIVHRAMIEVETTSNTAPFMRLSHKSGSSVPQTRFRVENDGRLYCTSVYVSWADSIPVPDYVFKPNYDLMPLGDLKAYVNKNSHLPNIPNEAEIKAEGVNLQEMQMKLLEKVEELTLYVIAINDKNTELEKQNKVLTEQIEMLKAASIKN